MPASSDMFPLNIKSGLVIAEMLQEGGRMNGMMETSELNGGNLVTMTLDQTTTTKTSETLNKASTGLHAIRETTNRRM